MLKVFLKIEEYVILFASVSIVTLLINGKIKSKKRKINMTPKNNNTGTDILIITSIKVGVMPTRKIIKRK